MPTDEEERLHRLLDALLRPRIGHAPRPWPAAMRRTLEALARERHLPLDHFLSRLLAQPEDRAIDAIVGSATITHTALFRHRAHLERLQRELAGLPHSARLWSAGCATGEEPYSMALAAREIGVEVSVLATDVNPSALEVARAGRYSASLARRAGVDAGGATWEVPAAVRACVRFERISITAPEPTAGEGPFDVIFCRNVLIYFEPHVSTRALERLLSLLRPGGSLVVAPVEALRALPDGLRRADPLGWLERASPRLPARRPPAEPVPRAPALPSATDDLLGRAARALGLGALDTAESSLRCVLASDAVRADAWFLLGEVLARRGERTQARTAFATAARHAASEPDGETLANAATRRARAMGE